jgi:transposase
MIECGFSLREIGKRLDIHHSTPSIICRAWSEKGLRQHLQGAGRPRITIAKIGVFNT